MMVAPMPSATVEDGLGLLGLNPETSAPPESRIKNASEGRKTHAEMMRQDQARNLQRSRYDFLLDGEPPFDQSVLQAKGQGGRTNVNWGDARSVMDAIEAGLIDMNVSVETLLSVPLFKAAIPDDETRFNLEDILADEISRTIRSWEEYDRMYLNLGRNCFWQGVGIAYFEDARDWRCETTGLGDFVIPNGTKASENRIPVASCIRYVELHELWGYIKDEENAAKMGWNVDAVKQALISATPDAYLQGIGGWQRVQERMRNNDIGAGIGGRTKKVGLIYMWVQEFDGSVSKYITTENALASNMTSDNEPWLYARRGIYPEMRRGMIFFTYSIGEHGTYHSISGLGRRIFPQANTLNRAMCTMLDAAITGAGVFMQPETEAAMTKMQLIPIGGALTILPAKEHGDMVLRPMPDLSHGIQPIIQDMRNTMGKRSGQFQGESGPTAVEKTRFQVAAELEALGKVGATQTNLWYGPWTRLLREMARRMCNPDYSYVEPGGKEVQDFHKRLMLRLADAGWQGEIRDLFAAIDFDGIKADRAIGAGSGASRVGRLTQLSERSGNLGETGRHRLERDIFAAILDGDYTQADRYIPREPEPTPPIDTQFAELENMMVDLGQKPVVLEGQMPMVHLQVHSPKLLKMAQEAEGNEDAMIAMAEPMLTLHTHCIEHLETIQDAEPIQVQVAEFRQFLQQVGEVVGNAVRKADKAKREAAQEQQEGEGQDPMLVQKLAEANIKLQSIRTQANLKAQIEAEKHEQKMRQEQEKFRMDMAHKDAATGAELLVNARRKLADTVTQQKKIDDALEVAKIKRSAAKAKPKKKAE